MKRWKGMLAVIVAAGMLMTSLSTQAEEFKETKYKNPKAGQAYKEKESEYAEGEAIILYREASVRTKILAAKGISKDIQIDTTYVFDEQDTKNYSADAAKKTGDAIYVSLVKSRTCTTKELINKLSARSDVLYAEPNYRIRALDSDPYKKYQWALENNGQNAGTNGIDLSVEELPESTGDTEQVIALVDTGMDYENDDLKAAVWNNPYNSKALRGAHGYDFINQDTDPMDDNGHGSHCFGIMAAESDNGIGIAGVAAGKNIKIMALKILDSNGYGYSMESVGAYNYIYKAQQLGVNVVAINNSWAGMAGQESRILKKLINLTGEKGAVTVCAAGNDSENNDEVITMPANIDSPYVISVAALNEKGELADFSNFGSESVDIAAPGADILSTVVTDTFNPGIYDEEKRNAICELYEDFTDGTLVEMEDNRKPADENGEQTAKDDGQTENNGELTESNREKNEGEIVYKMQVGEAKATVELTKEEYAGTTGEKEKSLKWTIRNAKEDETYYLLFPYTSKVSDTAIHQSVMIRGEVPEEMGEGYFASFYEESLVRLGDSSLDENGNYDAENESVIGTSSIGNYWSHICGESMRKVQEPEERIMSVQLMAASDGDYTIYIDDIGISKANVESVQFGRYDFYSGTSMATPHITAAIAAVSDSYGGMDATDKKAMVIGCSRRLEPLNGKVSSGGMLDFSNISVPRMSVSAVELDKDNNIEIRGNYLKGADITVNDKKVTPVSHEDKKVVIGGKDLVNTEFKLTVVKNDDTYSKTCFFSTGKSMNYEQDLCGYMAPGGTMLSDGEVIYEICDTGEVGVIRYIETEEGKKERILDYIGEGYSINAFGSEYANNVNYRLRSDSGVVCANRQLWTVLTLDTGFFQKSILAAFDYEKGWIKAAEIPKEFAGSTGVILGAYNGNLYLMGGFDEAKKQCSTMVMSYDVNKKAWNKAQQLPDGRAFSKALQVGGSLIVTLGCGDQEGCPVNLIYNGKSWSVSRASLKINSEDFDYYNYEDEGVGEEKAYAKAQIGLIKDGIVYVGKGAEGLGEIYSYQVKEDKFTALEYNFSNRLVEGEIYKATTMNDKLYVISGIYEESFEYDFENSNREEYNGQTEDYDMTEQDIKLYSMEVPSGAVEIKADTANDYVIDGAGVYLPGDTIRLVPMANEECYIVSFTVGGKEVKPNPEGKYQYTCIASDDMNGAKAVAKVNPYVMDLMVESGIEIAAGESYTPMVTIFPENAGDVKLKWESLNTNIATVDQNGQITVSPNAKIGDIATVRVTALDRGTVFGECMVIVSEKTQENVLPKKNSKVKSGGLTFKVTKSAEKNGTVSCTAVNNKKSKKITIPDTFKINGYTFKVTKIESNAFKGLKNLKTVSIGKNVTSIGKNAFKGCKKLQSVTIKSSKLKSIGKGAFSGINKKAVIKVPKKYKKNYSTKLKKSGYKGKIK